MLGPGRRERLIVHAHNALVRATGDGIVDIVTGTFIMEHAPDTNSPWLTFFERR